jgi:hypothetical protein
MFKEWKEWIIWQTKLLLLFWNCEDIVDNKMVIILNFHVHVLVLDISLKKWFSWNGGNLESQNI